MNKRLGSIAIVLAAVAAAAGLLAGPSKSAAVPPNCGIPFGCVVTLTGTGPSPSTLTMDALGYVSFYNPDSVSHTVVFANGLCSLTLTPNTNYAGCPSRFLTFAGSYAYTVDGKFPGSVVTTPRSRSVSLTARTHSIRGGTGLTLRGQVTRFDPGRAPPPPVVVLARHTSTQPFEPVATVRLKGGPQSTYRWKLKVQPEVSTTYIAKVTGQRLCYFPASQCEQIAGQVWVNAKSHPFTVRVRR
jgi:hypothetical protein